MNNPSSFSKNSVESSASARVPRAFLFAVFAVATLVGALIAYFGVTGHLGWGIP